MSGQSFPGFPKEGLQFLRSLKRHNKREWFQQHRTIYESAVKAPMEALVQALAADFAVLAPEMIASPKTSIYRIYRDTRFSKDKSPYKTHIAASFPRKGLEKHEGAGFYLHIAPSELLIGGGLYMPLPADLNLVRSAIATNHVKFVSIVESKNFRKIFGQLSGHQLSRVPRGFAVDHPAADYLRFKQFLAGRNLPPQEATTPRFHKIIIETFTAMLPLIRFLNEPILQARRVRERQGAVMGMM